jgi:uncharacterized protein
LRLVASILGLAPESLGGLAGIEEEARRLLGGDPAHGWPHVVRVARWASRIVAGEGLRPRWRVLYPAIVLHDIGRALAAPGVHHAVASAEYAARRLSGLLPPGEVEQVRHAILAHSYSLGVRAETPEARVLSDADKLDALGAVGIARVFHTGCQLGRGFEDSLRHFREKILRLPEILYYETSRSLARRLAGRVEEFLAWWSEETGE